MAKANWGVLLGGAYALGLAILLAVVLSLPSGTVCHLHAAVASVPLQAQRAAQLARVAFHAGSLGVKHLPAALGPQGARHRGARFCNRVQSSTGCSGQRLFLPLGALPAPTLVPVLVRVFFGDEEG